MAHAPFHGALVPRIPSMKLWPPRLRQTPPPAWNASSVRPVPRLPPQQSSFSSRSSPFWVVCHPTCVLPKPCPWPFGPLTIPLVGLHKTGHKTHNLFPLFPHA